jgi:hypothetical protein
MNVGFAISGDVEGRQGGIRSQQNISIGGQRTSFNHFSLDGVENTDVNFNRPVVLPSVDALLEFKVQTGIYPAEFGRVGQVNVATKSGGNQYHGALFEFLRNSALDAKPYDFSTTRSPKVPFRWTVWFRSERPRRDPEAVQWPQPAVLHGQFRGLSRADPDASPLIVSRSMPGAMAIYPAWRIESTIPPRVSGTELRSPLSRSPETSFPNRALTTFRRNTTNSCRSPTRIPARLPAIVLSAAKPTDRDQFLQRIDLVESARSSWFGRFTVGPTTARLSQVSS